MCEKIEKFILISVYRTAEHRMIRRSKREERKGSPNRPPTPTLKWSSLVREPAPSTTLSDNKKQVRNVCSTLPMLVYLRFTIKKRSKNITG